MKNFYLKLIKDQLNSRHIILLLVLLALWMYVPTLGLMELKSWDEAIYASISRTIFQTGDYLHLQYKGEPYFNKPPLFFYLTSWGYHLLGVNEFSSRIVSVLFGIACLILTYFFAKRLFSQNIGVIAVLLMLSNYHFFITVRHGRMESMVAFFIVFAIYSFYRLMDDIKWIYAFALAIGLGVLTKGGMGLLPLLVIFPFLIFYPVWLKRMFCVHTLFSIVLCLFMVLPWYLLQYQLYGAEYIRQFFDIQLVGRMKVAIEGHQGPWWYYLYRTSFYYFSNWSVLIFPGLVFIVWKSVKDKKPGTFLIAFFAWVVLLLFSFGVETKLSWYIFIIYIPVSMAVALMLDLLNGRLTWAKHFFLVTSLLSILIVPLSTIKTSNNDIKSLHPLFQKELNENSNVYGYNIEYASLNFYTNAQLKMVSKIEDLQPEKLGDHAFVVLKKLDFNMLAHPEYYLVLGENQHFVFLKLREVVSLPILQLSMKSDSLPAQL